MNINDIKYRYIVPLAERNERDEIGFLFDRDRIRDHKYQTCFCGEAALYNNIVSETESEHAEEFLRKNLDEFRAALKEEGGALPDGATEAEDLVAWYATASYATRDDKGSLFQPTVRERLEMYFSLPPIDVNSGNIQKHFGYPW